MKKEILYIFTDGASRGNPGPAAIAYSIEDSSGEILEEKGEYVGKQTNIVAEYRAIITALGIASKYSSGEISCTSDSDTVVKQINGKFKIKESHLKKLFSELKEKEKKFEKVTYTHKPREYPKISKMDRLVNKVLNQAKISSLENL